MIRKFFEGLTFGAGFAVSFLFIAWLGAGVLIPMIFTTPDTVTGPGRSLAELPTSPEESGPQFHELTVEEQIKKASVIALARYEPAPDGKQKAIIKAGISQPNPTTTRSQGAMAGFGVVSRLNLRPA
jgi:hypothetical protein